MLQLLFGGMVDVAVPLTDAQQAQLTATEVFAEGISSGGDQQCAICLGEFEDGEVLRRLPCLHRFHDECIKRHFETKHNCPVCRTDVVQP